MNKGKYYVLPKGAKVEKVKVEMYKAGDGFAYQDERLAEYNIAIGGICECGNYIEGKERIICNKCREDKQKKKYDSFELVEWDSETPLTLFNSDTYFYDEESIDDYCEYENVKKEDLELVLCEKNDPPSFDLQDYCYDYLPEDYSIYDCTNKNSGLCGGDVEKLVNDFLKGVSPVSWTGGNKRVKLDK